MEPRGRRRPLFPGRPRHLRDPRHERRRVLHHSRRPRLPLRHRRRGPDLHRAREQGRRRQALCLQRLHARNLGRLRLGRPRRAQRRVLLHRHRRLRARPRHLAVCRGVRRGRAQGVRRGRLRAGRTCLELRRHLQPGRGRPSRSDRPHVGEPRLRRLVHRSLPAAPQHGRQRLRKCNRTRDVRRPQRGPRRMDRRRLRLPGREPLPLRCARRRRDELHDPDARGRQDGGATL